jgi:DEAD/DEAH box helicase domain-containing protein
MKVTGLSLRRGRDVGFAIDRHRTQRGPLAAGTPFIALYDQIYGSLRISGRLLEDGLLAAVLERAVTLANDDALDGAVEAGEILVSMLASAKGPTERCWWEAEIRDAAAGGQFDTTTVEVILPGSFGLDVRHDNREFHVERVFFSPINDRVSYSGFNLRTRYGVVEIVPVNQIVPLEGESRLGIYDLETGQMLGEQESLAA